MAIKCGRGNHYHDSVADVRACYNGGDAVATKSTVPAGQRLSEKQVKMVNVLIKKLGLVWDGATPVDELPRWGTGRVLIDQLKSAEQAKAHGKPFATPDGCKISSKPQTDGGERQPYPDVPQGYYATKSATGNNDLDFWFVDVVEREGQWKGFRSVSRVIGGRSNVRVKGITRRDALVAIEKAGYEAAGMRFAQELGRCYRCGKHLTDDLSRQLGIGPVCRAA